MGVTGAAVVAPCRGRGWMIFLSREMVYIPTDDERIILLGVKRCRKCRVLLGMRTGRCMFRSSPLAQPQPYEALGGWLNIFTHHTLDGDMVRPVTVCR